MAGSKTEINLHLIYDALNDKAYWALNSTCSILELAQPQRWVVINSDQDNYSVVSKLAGPIPKILVEEVIQRKQGTDNA